jgi:hypothetical protein
MNKPKGKVEIMGTVVISVKLLERIADYYEFPLAVFFGNEKCFKTRTRNELLIKKAQWFDEIWDITEKARE